jgi:hypothetical protein
MFGNIFKVCSSPIAKAMATMVADGTILVQLIIPLIYWLLSESPFNEMYGYEPPLTAMPESASSVPPSVQQWIQQHLSHNAMLRELLATAQNRTKLQADKHRVDRVFQAGDLVLLRLQPYCHGHHRERSLMWGRTYARQKRAAAGGAGSSARKEGTGAGSSARKEGMAKESARKKGMAKESD